MSRALQGLVPLSGRMVVPVVLLLFRIHLAKERLGVRGNDYSECEFILKGRLPTNPAESFQKLNIRHLLRNISFNLIYYYLLRQHKCKFAVCITAELIIHTGTFT